MKPISTVQQYMVLFEFTRARAGSSFEVVRLCTLNLDKSAEVSRNGSQDDLLHNLNSSCMANLTEQADQGTSHYLHDLCIRHGIEVLDL